MSYTEAMEAAGAEILAYEEFGSYQGEWYAKVNFEGKTFWVNGSFGSCSGCDAFQAEFNWGDELCGEHRYAHPAPAHCEACDAVKADKQKRLAEFGLGYLQSGDMTDSEALSNAKRYDWDSTAGDMEAFIRANAVNPDCLPVASAKSEEAN